MRRPRRSGSSLRPLRPPQAVRLTRGARHCGSGGGGGGDPGRAGGGEGGKRPRLTGSGVGRGRVGRGRGAGGAAPAPSEHRPARRRHVRHQQPRSREETAGKHAGRPAGPEPGVQEKISSRQGGEERPGRGAASEGRHGAGSGGSRVRRRGERTRGGSVPRATERRCGRGSAGTARVPRPLSAPSPQSSPAVFRRLKFGSGSVPARCGERRPRSGTAPPGSRGSASRRELLCLVPAGAAAEPQQA